MPPRARKTPAPLTGARRTAEPDALDAAPTPPPAAAPEPESVESEPQRTSTKVQRTINLEVSILEDARAAVTYLAAYVPEAGVKSLADLVNPALAQAVRQLEKTYNKGEPFRRVGRMQVGRPTSR